MRTVGRFEKNCLCLSFPYLPFARTFAAVALAGASLSSALADTTRPRIGLVLGGGGARGAAHIGVLEVLEKLRIPVDCVTGTSMGALIGGAYASGLTPEQMTERMSGVDWNDLFEDNPGRAELNYRERRLAESYYPGLELGVTEQGVRTAQGFIQGQKLKLFFNTLVGAEKGVRTIEGLGLPLGIIATDIGNGDRVAYREGDLSAAMRASMSVPGLLAPTEYNGRRLVDGGLVDNLPVGEVRSLCNADVVIAVNVGSPLAKPEDVNSIRAVSSQMIGVLTSQNAKASLASLKPDDILITPDLEGITAADFAKYREATARGRAAADAVVEKLKAYAVPDSEYIAWRAKVEGAPRLVPRIDEVQIAGLTRVNPEAVTRHLHVRPGDQLSTAQMDRDLGRIYGDGYYENVDYSVLTTRERNILRITPTEKRWGPNYLRFGMQLETSNESNQFVLRGAYHKRWLNSLGGESLSGIDIGQRSAVFTEFYQPLDAKQRFFVEPLLALRRDYINLYQDDDRIAEYRVIEKRAAANVGMNAGGFGQARLGWQFRQFDTVISTGAANLPTGERTVKGWISDLDIDQLDRAYFPTRGWAAKVNFFSARDFDYSKLSMDLRAAKTWAPHTLSGRLYYVDSPKGNLPIFDAEALGGFLRLSGYSADQIIGGKIRFGSVRAERIIGKMPLGITGDLRTGLSLEMGKVDQRFTETNLQGWQRAFSVFLGGETPVGPLYLGFGRVLNGGPSSIYLYLGLIGL
ncbi:MAG: patatin-like phospholipase family protein [Pseudomonadota bacterium]